ncbi:DODA-type extradiol aromatic ring-opening family dioxygenase [Sulfurimonas microaerophilic]|uniref:DODA-type extradiol aromatic ring-opening family dioxygenase n=1 Tax=Sulfurimonas microaerophilic TaxID=3058392 RepID=UPI0027146C06|nr:class III extradiol ring-cleavage dioxygenase [Sulfurimonas sp. hsl 1-7]
MNTQKPRVLFLSHGGGPLPVLGDEGHLEMVEKLKDLALKLPKPSAILLISAHWEDELVCITSARHPSLIYDYYGFPKESYDIKYPCNGEPSLAREVDRVLTNAGIETELNEDHGFDHGLFIPLKIMYPEADIPCVEISLLNTLDPLEHINIGSALADINYDNLLIIGSGFSFHNMRAFFVKDTAETISMNEQFEQWLSDTCSNKDLSDTVRTDRLVKWESAPYARYCHPREEHLLPLHVCYGVHQSYCNEYVELNIMNKKSSFYLW